MLIVEKSGKPKRKKKNPSCLECASISLCDCSGFSGLLLLWESQQWGWRAVWAPFCPCCLQWMVRAQGGLALISPEGLCCCCFCSSVLLSDRSQPSLAQTVLLAASSLWSLTERWSHLSRSSLHCGFDGEG